MKKASKKTQPRRRLSAQSRKQQAAFVFDQALPLSLRTESLSPTTSSPVSHTLPLAQTASPAPSLHVLNLRPTEEFTHLPTTERASAPEEILPTFEEFVASLSVSMKEEEELPILFPVKEEDVAAQLAEDDVNLGKKSARSWPTFSLPALPHIAWRNPVPQSAQRAWSSSSPLARGVASFVILSFAFVLPLQATSTISSVSTSRKNMLTEGAEALALLESAAKETSRVDFSAAKETFTKASVSLGEAWDTLEHLGSGVRALAVFLPREGARLRSAEAVLAMGKALTKAAALLSEGVETSSTSVDQNLSTKISLLERYISSAMPFLEDAVEASTRVEHEAIPQDRQEQFLALRESLPRIQKTLRTFLDTTEILHEVLGTHTAKRYLVVFQNQTELRPTGGFIGSFADMEVSAGEITALSIPGGGSYALQGVLTEYVAAPPPLQLVNARWEFQDANWFPDFPASAKKLLWFDANSGGATKDGVLAINASFVADLLEILGPISIPAYGKILSAENFITETQMLVENDAARASGNPKQFLADLAPLLLARLQTLDGPTFLDALTLLQTGVAQKDVQMYFTDPAEQEAARAFGVTGELRRTNGDYLLVAEANIGGEKTDAVIDETVEVDSTISPAGVVRNTVTVVRTHHGIPGARFTGANNVTFVRLYVPRGATLIDTDGATPPKESAFEIADLPLATDADLAFTEETSARDPRTGTWVSEEFGKTVFGDWIQTRPGTTSQISFTYELPWRVPLTRPTGAFTAVLDRLGFEKPTAHTLTVDTQSGTVGRTTRVRLTPPANLPTLWSSHPLTDGVIKADIENRSPGFVGVLFE